MFRKNNKKAKYVAALLALLMMVSISAVGCGQGQDTNGEGEQLESKGSVTIGYVEGWAEGVAMTHLAQAILEDKLGYEVETKAADVGPVYQAVAQGEYDAFMDAWLPVTHQSYMERLGDQLDKYGPVYEGARIGLVVPSYVEIDSIEEMNDHKDKFDGKITGIDAGAGIMEKTRKAIEEYDLDFELLEGSGPAMTAALGKAIDDNEWIVVTGWAPHWKFAKWDLKFLEDPKKIYGEEEEIYIVTTKGLPEEMPEVTSLFKNMKMDDQQLGELEGYINEGMEPLEAGRLWMSENEEVINEWLSTQ